MSNTSVGAKMMMSDKMNKNEWIEKLKSIPTVEPDDLDRQMMKAAIKNSSDEGVTLDNMLNEMNYNGKISLRVPRTLHKELVVKAKQEGVSLNQFLLYKVSK